jgi:hypothetical protein
MSIRVYLRENKGDVVSFYAPEIQITLRWIILRDNNRVETFRIPRNNVAAIERR